MSSGADADLKNPNNCTAREMAIGNNPDIENLLRSGSLVDGPPIRNAEKARKGKRVQWVSTQTVRAPRDNPAKMAACRIFTATMIEFYIDGNERRSPPIPTSIHELLYDKGPRAIRKEKFTERPDQSPSFTWYHLPANNVSFERVDVFHFASFPCANFADCNTDGMGGCACLIYALSNPSALLMRFVH